MYAGLQYNSCQTVIWVVRIHPAPQKIKSVIVADNNGDTFASGHMPGNGAGSSPVCYTNTKELISHV